jgi:FlaA1/EpsC-like NDP-sugar epimerase
MEEARMEPIFEDNFITSSDMLEDVDTASPIKDYLRDKTIFLTGGFGFLGKLLIEKLLRCDVKRVYLLVRAKKGKTLEERFEKLTAEPVSVSLHTFSAFD